MGIATSSNTFEVFVARSSDNGGSWPAKKNFGPNTYGADVVVGKNGVAYVFYLAYTFNNPTFTVWHQYNWQTSSGASWSDAATIGTYRSGSTNLFATGVSGSGMLKRSNATTNPLDYFDSNALPRVAVNPANGRIYVVYADLPTSGSSTDRGDIFIKEG